MGLTPLSHPWRMARQCAVVTGDGEEVFHHSGGRSIVITLLATQPQLLDSGSQHRELAVTTNRRVRRYYPSVLLTGIFSDQPRDHPAR